MIKKEDFWKIFYVNTLGKDNVNQINIWEEYQLDRGSIYNTIWGQVLQYNKGYAILAIWPDHYG
jgi:hypothetical protein